MTKYEKPIALAITLFALGIYALNFFLASRLVPLPDGDPVCFYPISVSFASEGKLVHPFYSPIERGSDLRFVWHGWLYSMVSSAINLNASYAGAVMGDHLLIGLSVTLAVGMVFNVTRNYLLAALSIPILYAMGIYNTGRPDLLAYPIVLLVFWPIVSSGDPYRALPIRGVLLGLLGITQPVIAVLAVLLSIVPLCVTSDFRKLFGSVALLAVTSSGTLLAVTWLLYPFDLRDWLEGLLEHSRLISSRTDGRFFYYYFFQPDIPLVGLWGLAGCVMLFFWIRAIRLSSAFNRIVFPLSVVPAGYAIWNFGFRIPPTCYNLIVFTPLMMILLLKWLSPRESRKEAPSPLLRVAALVFFLGMTSISIAGLLRYEIVAVYSATKGLRPQDFKNELSARVPSGARLQIDPAFVYLFFDAGYKDRVTVTEYAANEIVPDYIVAQQINRGRRTPSSLPGYELVLDRFHPSAIEVAGVKLGNTPKASNFALYERKRGTDP